jgi:hypothetical protein
MQDLDAGAFPLQGEGKPAREPPPYAKADGPVRATIVSIFLAMPAAARQIIVADRQ